MNPPDAATTALAAAAGEYVTQTVLAMRADSRHAVDTWLRGAQARVGGTLVLHAPNGKRDLVEAACCTERYDTQADDTPRR